MRTLATLSVRHRRLVMLLWLALLVGATLAARIAGSGYSNQLSLPGTPSNQAVSLLKSASPRVSGDTERVVFDASRGESMTNPAIEARVTQTLTRLSRVPHVTTVVSPYSAAGSGQISSNKKIAFATITFDEEGQLISDSAAKHFVQTAQSGDRPGLQVAVSGLVAENANEISLGGAGFGLLLAAVVLFLTFGSLFAMSLPLISVLASLGAALGIVDLLSHAITIPTFSSQLTLLIGLGVGVDYALFIVTRYRQGLLAGRDVESAVVTAIDTSGRAVLFAGSIVCVALLGMLALGVSFLDGLAVGAAVGVAATVLAALTLLPALLGFIGPRVLSRRQRRRLAAEGPAEAAVTGFWSRWSLFVQRRPAVPVVVALVIIGTLASAFFSLRLGTSDQGNDPVGTSTRTAYDMLATGFGPGFNGPLQLVADVPATAEPEVARRVVAEVTAQPDVARVEPAVVPAKQGTDVLLVNVYPKTAPQSTGTTDLINHLRVSTLPKATAGSGIDVYVGGQTANFVDFDHVISEKLPLFIAVVILLSFLLLAVVFRSVVIPLTGALMNLLSLTAALGILVAVFEKGRLASVIGVSSRAPIESYLPVMMFAIVFGLSMDYQVFLVTRIHEEWLTTHDNAAAVRNGLAATGKTITAAALIMIMIFGSFASGGERVIKEFGLGLAGAVLVDAVLIRMAIVPALMRILGEANWWFPRWADRLVPHLSVEPQTHDWVPDEAHLQKRTGQSVLGELLN